MPGRAAQTGRSHHFDWRADHLAEAPWLFNSFVKSNAADVCACLGLPLTQYRSAMLACGVSLDLEARADQPAQDQALRLFVSTPDVTRAVGARIDEMRRLVLGYAAQHHLAEPGTGLVDISWTGRMVASLIHVGEAEGMTRPHVLFWGHEPRPATGWTDPRTGGLLRLQHRDRARPAMASPRRRAEALAWGAYPYDSDPAGTAIRPLARPFTIQDHTTRGDRAWIAGSLVLSPPQARAAYLRHAPEHERTGAPETD